MILVKHKYRKTEPGAEVKACEVYTWGSLGNVRLGLSWG